MKTVWAITMDDKTIDAPEIERTASRRYIMIDGEKIPVFYTRGKGYYVMHNGNTYEARNMHIEKLCGLI